MLLCSLGFVIAATTMIVKSGSFVLSLHIRHVHNGGEAGLSGPQDEQGFQRHFGERMTPQRGRCSNPGVPSLGQGGTTGCLLLVGRRVQARPMFAVDEAAACAIRQTCQDGADLSGVVELRRHFPPILDKGSGSGGIPLANSRAARFRRP